MPGTDLLRLIIGSVGGVAALAVAVLALDDVIILSLLHHHHLVNAALASSSDCPDVQWDLVVTARALTSQPIWNQMLFYKFLLSLGREASLVVVMAELEMFLNLFRRYLPKLCSRLQ